MQVSFLLFSFKGLISPSPVKATLNIFFLAQKSEKKELMLKAVETHVTGFKKAMSGEGKNSPCHVFLTLLWSLGSCLSCFVAARESHAGRESPSRLSSIILSPQTKHFRLRGMTD